MTNIPTPGGKVKPLKAPKKANKDMDEEEVAFKEKQAAGISPPILPPPSPTSSHILSVRRPLLLTLDPQMPKHAKKWRRRQKAKVP